MALRTFVLLVGALSLTAPTSAHDSCGHRTMVGPPGASRIVGGYDAAVGAWPWQVSIQLWSMHQCGGTIIDELWVVTAKHCFIKALKISEKHFRVVAGLNTLSAPGDHVQVRSISGLKMHKGFNEFTGEHDIALMLLNAPLNFTDYVQPACIPDEELNESNLKISHCFISGWGSKHFKGGMADRLQEAEVGIIDTKTCNLVNWYSGRITENMICAGVESGEVDACQGDSGGPLQCYSEEVERFYLIGVTSFGDKCGLPRKPGVYARTSKYADWLGINITEPVSAAHRVNTRLISALLTAALLLL